jgi:catechol 2,3-dioxygenase-like lactoylglutathione lyase family enzyme
VPSSIRHLTIDCHDVELVGRFWAEVTGYVDDPRNPNEPGDPEWVLVPPDGAGPGLLFLPVPDDKVVKNRLHLDLTPATTRDAEVERLTALGATVVADHRRPDGAGWVTLADPEGNEFCVERSATERGEG